MRRDFLDPFFRALGWDVDNTAGYAKAYRDVIHGEQVKISGAVKAPDYGFRISGQRKFFLEAKKPPSRSFTKYICDAPPANQPRKGAKKKAIINFHVGAGGGYLFWTVQAPKETNLDDRTEWEQVNHHENSIHF